VLSEMMVWRPERRAFLRTSDDSEERQKTSSGHNPQRLFRTHLKRCVSDSCQDIPFCVLIVSFDDFE